MERFNHKKLNEVEGKAQYRLEVSDTSRFAVYKIWTQRWKLIVPGKRLERI
jgi:hypothetical protein